jgi:hypothetical protein
MKAYVGIIHGGVCALAVGITDVIDVPIDIVNNATIRIAAFLPFWIFKFFSSP